MATIKMSLADLPAHLESLAARLSNPDFREAMDVIEGLIREDAGRNFAGSHDPDGRSWPPLKKQQGRTRWPLVRTGRLERAATGGAGATRRRDRSALSVGVDVPYAGFQQRGTRTIPARRFLGIGQDLMVKIVAALREFARPYQWGDS